MSGALKARGDATILMPPGQSPGASEPAGVGGEFGGYRLLGLLGRGGMGTVYEAEQVTTGRRVALKVLGQQLDSPDMRQRFLREGRLAAGVSHPNSLYVFGSEEIEGVPVIIMEIAGSGTLKDRLKKGGPLPVKEAVDAILDIVAGLEAAIVGGVLHRDIKPSNCFVDPDGSVKIGDFGLSVSTLARDDSFITATGVIMGTPAYASPEQLRGDNLDVRADVYSVGATLFTLLTNRAPFEGDNAVQVVANAVNQKPKPLTELRQDVPPGLDRVVARCLAKEPDRRYADYRALRNALLPFSSKEPEPASMKVRALAGWIDYLTAFLVPYVVIILSVGPAVFHIQPLIDRTLDSARFHIAFLSFGFLYFAVVEGIWSAGLGKRLMGLRVVRTNDRRLGVLRALIRILIPIGVIEGVRIPFLLATFSATDMNSVPTADVLLLVGASNVCPWLAVLLTLTARRENGFATLWDLVTGSRVVVQPTGTERPRVEPAVSRDEPVDSAERVGPYEVMAYLLSGEWIAARDPVLRRQVWLLRGDPSGLPPVRRNLSRAGRLRWLQRVEHDGASWDAFEAPQGKSLSDVFEVTPRVPWGTLRHWLHDLASELWAAAEDQTLAASVSLDHVWITTQGQAVLLDRPWAGVRGGSPSIPINDLAGQQRFLSSVAAHADSSNLPLHARPVLQNLQAGRFEKLSFLTGTLRGLLDKPAEVSKAVRAGAMFMLPVYVWILCLVPNLSEGNWAKDSQPLAWVAVIFLLGVLGAMALAQFVSLPFRSTASHSIFRLAVINAKGVAANFRDLLLRWTIVWLSLFGPMAFVGLLVHWGKPYIAFFTACVLLSLWIGAGVYAVIHPNRGLHDRLAGQWVVRR
jgi:uncharacterized RDD family membrane protein YckC